MIIGYVWLVLLFASLLALVLAVIATYLPWISLDFRLRIGILQDRSYQVISMDAMGPTRRIL